MRMLHTIKNIKEMIKFVFLLNLLSFFNVFADTVASEHVKLQLVSEVETIQAGKPFWIAVHFEIEKDWHIYWKTPGDAGMAPQFIWDVPRGFQVGEIQWPYPKRIILSTLANFGYENEVLLMTEITPSSELEDGTEIAMTVHVDLLICKEECIPAAADLELLLEVKNDLPSFNKRWVQEFARTRDRLPLANPGWDIQAFKEDTVVTFYARPPEWFTGKISGLSFFPYSSDILRNAAIQRFNVIDNVYSLKVELTPTLLQIPDNISGILVAQEGWRGPESEKAIILDLPLQQQAVDISLTGSEQLSSIWIAFLFAFIGGVILNLMPCVLPVLSLKILGFVQQAGEERKRIFQHGLIFTSGVLVSFWILAGLLIMLRAGGAELGWGFQLQSPNFIFILSIFFFLFALSLFGIFEIGASLTGVGQRATRNTDWFGTFFSGVTATIVATPCTAPFMGSALGYALSQPAYYALFIFSALGLGMSAPYILLSSYPPLLKFVPKPGRWMETLKQFMGFLLAGTVIWLVWVLGVQNGLNAVLVLLIGLLIISIAAWISGRWGSLINTKKVRITANTLALILIILVIIFGLSSITIVKGGETAMVSDSEVVGINWLPYSDERFEQLRQTNSPIFIDFTAAWCLSCQVNERVALRSSEVQEKFRELNIAVLKADWTTRDETITRALARYGRNSVPLYVLYGKNKDEVIMLPEIITPAIVLQALEKIN